MTINCCTATFSINNLKYYSNFVLEIFLELKGLWEVRIPIATLCSSINNLKYYFNFAFEYFLELKGLCEELNSHISLPIYTCIQQWCCTTLQLAQNYRLEYQVIQFRTGLNDSFCFMKT